LRKPDFGQSIQILANVGVIAGILFVAVEIRQNNQLLTAESIGTVFENRIDRQDRVMENHAYTAVMAKNSRGEMLSDEEEMIVTASHDRAFIAWQREYLLYQLGVLPEAYLRASFGSMKSVFPDREGTLPVYDRWQEWKSAADPMYREFVELCILAECEEIPR
jgi:hypothetical protein